LHGAGEIEVLPIRVEDVDILDDPHQSHWDHDRFVPALPFDQARCHVGGPAGASQGDAPGVEAVILGGRRRYGCGRYERRDQGCPADVRAHHLFPVVTTLCSTLSRPLTWARGVARRHAVDTYGMPWPRTENSRRCRKRNEFSYVRTLTGSTYAKGRRARSRSRGETPPRRKR